MEAVRRCVRIFSGIAHLWFSPYMSLLVVLFCILPLGGSVAEWFGVLVL